MTRRLLVLLSTVLALVLLTACDDSNKLQGTPVSQALSPNGRIAVLVTRHSGNATVSFVDRVYLKPSGSDHAQLVLKADKGDKITVKWVDDRHLQIDAPCAQVFSYRNFFYLMKGGELVYPVSIDLVNHGLCST